MQESRIHFDIKFASKINQNKIEMSALIYKEYCSNRKAILMKSKLITYFLLWIIFKTDCIGFKGININPIIKTDVPQAILKDLKEG
jgi:hypothetical protein